MDLVLSLSDLIQVGPCSFRNTMALLPLGSKKKRQKIVIGDDHGELSCFEMKGSELIVAWKSKPSDGKEIARIELSGSTEDSDKLFVSSGQQIHGINKKGKGFFMFNTNLTEVITTMFADDTKLYTGGEYIFNIFDNGKDIGFFMSSDRINDLCCAYITRETSYDSVIASQNKKVQVLQDVTPVLEATLDGAVNEIHVNKIRRKDKAKSKLTTEIVYGTLNGMIGSLDVTSSGIRPSWTVASDKKGTINCIQTYDLTHDGVGDILIGRDDGSVQVYSFDMGEAPEKQFEEFIGESIRSIDAGVVKSAEFEEVVLSTYSGRVISLTSEPLHAVAESDAYGRSKEVVERESQIVRLRKELDKLAGTIEKEKAKVLKMSDKGKSEAVAVHQQFKVNYQFALNPEEAGYLVTVEIAAPIDVVTLQSTIPIDLLDTESNLAIISQTNVVTEDGNRLLATCRCQDSTNRLEFKLRTVEGQYGDLQAIIIAKMEPKSAVTVKFPIKPLSLHHRIYDYVIDRPVNTLKITGVFTIGQMHEWVCRCLADVPPRITETELEMSFRNAFLGSILTCSYKKGEGVFKSDSVTTIAILKEVITKEATSRKININTTFDIVYDTVVGVLQLLRPKLDYQLSLARKVELIEALKEVKLAGAEGSVGFLDAEYLDIVNNAEKYQKAFKHRPKSLETLYGIVQDLFVDKFKFKGVDARGRLPLLNDVLMNYSFEKLVDFFSV